MNIGAFGERFPYTNFHDLNLDWILKQIKEIAEAENAQNENIEELEKRVQANEEWINNYNPNLIQSTVRQYIESILATMIFVEINDEGYIVYYIPDSWDEITFNTTELDIILALQPEYGHLVLSY